MTKVNAIINANSTANENININTNANRNRTACPLLTTKELIQELLNIDNDKSSIYNNGLSYDELEQLRRNIIECVCRRIENGHVNKYETDLFIAFYIKPCFNN